MNIHYSLANLFLLKCFNKGELIMKKYTKEELYKMDAVDVYKLVLEQKHIKKFPNGFWQQPEALDNAAKCVKYLIEDILNLSENELKKQLSKKLFVNNGLCGMLSNCFNNSPIKAIELIYPNKFKPWELNQVPQGYWSCINNGIEATRWLIEDRLKLTDEELKEQLSQKLFADNGLGGMLKHCFDASPIKAIKFAYPGKFKPWDFPQVPLGYWEDINHGIEATRWLIEEKLKLTDEELKEQLSAKLFADNDLGSMLKHCFDSSPYRAVNAAYPGKFKPWEFSYSIRGYWEDISNGIEATRWLIEEKLKLTDEELKEQLSIKLFEENGLSSVLRNCFDWSPYRAINAAYPGKFKKEDFKNCNYMKQV